MGALHKREMLSSSPPFANFGRGVSGSPQGLEYGSQRPGTRNVIASTDRTTKTSLASSPVETSETLRRLEVTQAGWMSGYVESWDRHPEDRGTLFGAASGLVEIFKRPESGASSHLWDERPPEGAFMVVEVEEGV